jgi:hypothetical protein
VRLLRDEYVVPVLGLPPGAVCERTYRLVGSLAAPGPGFETDWRTAAHRFDYFRVVTALVLDFGSRKPQPATSFVVTCRIRRL